jgi:hypothetical protein
MKRIFAIALLAAATFISAGNAFAQDNTVKANVPFSFTVGNYTLPAGTYTISSVNNSPTLLNINCYKGAHAMGLGQPDQNNPKHANELEFHHYGDQYFLSEIRTADSSMNLHFATTKAEKRARAATQVATSRVNDPVLIALNK